MTEPALPPEGSPLRTITSTSGNLKTSSDPSFTGVPPSVSTQNLRCASGSRPVRCRCPIETPAWLGAGTCRASAAASVIEAAKILIDSVSIAGVREEQAKFAVERQSQRWGGGG